jgi:hypothetical protein
VNREERVTFHGDRLKHFSEEAWADFVRDTTAPKMKTAMHQHINDGCRKCETALQVWQGVLSIARAENSITPPDDIVRVVKSQFVSDAPATKHKFRLLFDSSLQPAGAGVRGSVTARQFLFETDDYYIDLRLEPNRSTKSASLVGQVMNRTSSGRAPQEMKVRLCHGLRSVAETATNRFGEFHLEFEADQNLSLALGNSEQNEIILPLYGVSKPNNQKDLE